MIRPQINRISLPLPSSFGPVLCCDKNNNQFLVPHRQVSGSEISGWKPSFPTIECKAFNAFDPVVTTCYCLLKLLVLLAGHIDERYSRKTKPSSYALKTCLFNYVKENPTPWDNRQIVKHCRGICKEFIDTKTNIYSFFEKSLPVYVIKYESKQAMNKIRNRLKSVKELCFISSKMCSCKKFNICKCNLL